MRTHYEERTTPDTVPLIGRMQAMEALWLMHFK